jgi:translation initiation factor IF-1
MDEEINNEKELVDSSHRKIRLPDMESIEYFGRPIYMYNFNTFKILCEDGKVRIGYLSGIDKTD